MAQIDPVEPLETLDGCYVEPITTQEAKRLILRHEWLGSMPGRVAACYGLRAPWGELLGTVVLGWSMSHEARELCGKGFRNKAICLERGACVHWAPPNAASHLISQTLKQATKTHGWHIYFAYCDPEAGEGGTIYQASNWLYTGDSRAVENYVMSDGKLISERSLRLRGITKREAIKSGAEVIMRSPKRRFVRFTGNAQEKRVLRRSLKYEVLPYPT